MPEIEPYPIELKKRAMFAGHFINAFDFQNQTEDQRNKSGAAFSILARDLGRNAARAIIDKLPREYSNDDAKNLIKKHLPQFYPEYSGINFY